MEHLNVLIERAELGKIAVAVDALEALVVTVADYWRH